MHQIIRIHPDAPPQPQPGQACNGCGVCCLAEPCPAGMVVSRRRTGACAALRWEEGARRYVCGLLMGRRPWVARLMRRWIAAGQGCDATLRAEAEAA